MTLTPTTDEQIAAIRKDANRITAIIKQIDRLSAKMTDLRLELAEIKQRRGMA